MVSAQAKLRSVGVGWSQLAETGRMLAARHVDANKGCSAMVSADVTRGCALLIAGNLLEVISGHFWSQVTLC